MGYPVRENHSSMENSIILLLDTVHMWSNMQHIESVGKLPPRWSLTEFPLF